MYFFPVRWVFLSLLLLFYFVCMTILGACMSVHYMRVVATRSEEVMNPLGLELQMMMRCLVGSRN